ncbi:MAG: hypothetical protein IT178_06145 [Acidobacteria bacterium]|nr:hypothetical protein [Acidobacteriota bacterium]
MPFISLLPVAAIWIAFLIALPARPSPWLVLVSSLPLVAAVSWWLARRRGQRWTAFVRETLDSHALALVVLYALGVQLADTHGITTDGVTYFTQLRSLVFDRDLDIAREYDILRQPQRQNHIVPVGPLLLWAPLYLIVAAVDAVGRMVGAWSAPAERDMLGLGLPYVRAALLSSFAIGAAGLAAVHGYLRTRFPRGVAFTTSWLIFAATPLYWYMVYEPSMTHAASFGFVALFVTCAARWLTAPEGVVPDAGRTRALLLGTLIGLAFVARTQEVLFAIYPALLVLTAPRTPASARVSGALRLAGWAALGALPWVALQLGHSYVLFSRYEYQLMGQGGYFNPLHSRWIDTLFSSWHGFLSWTPVAYIAVAGTIAGLRRDWRWASSALVVLFLTAWVNGATIDWAGGWSFGGRRFSSTLAMLAPGLATVILFALRRPAVTLAPLVVAALAWNHLLMVQYTAGLLPKDEPVSFGRIVRQQADLHTRTPYFYPFAFPANAWFAWRHGLPIDKYDLLAPESMRATADLTFDRTVEKFLLDGWDVPGGDDWGSCWWIGATPAVLAVPLQLADGDVRITVKSRTRYDEPVVQATLALEINGVDVGRFRAGVPDASTATIDVPAATARALFIDGFNRVGFRQVALDRVDGQPLPERGRSRAVWPVAVYSLQIQ